MRNNLDQLIIGIVGPCGSGKSTLVASLKNRGLQARHIAQEHSYVPNMWQRMVHPNILIYLDVTYEQTLQRRRLNWTPVEYEEQLFRLRDARQSAALKIDTSALTIDQVLYTVLGYLQTL